MSTIPTSTPTPDNAIFAQIVDTLREYGLEDLSSWAYNELVRGASPQEIINSLYDQPKFRERFRGLFIRREQNLNAMTVNEYLAYETQAAQLMRFYGLPEGFYDSPDDFADLIGKDVSINELQTRFTAYAEAAEVNRPAYRQELARLYGEQITGEQFDTLTTGQLAAWIADPDRGITTIQTQLQAAKISAQGKLQGFADLNEAELHQLMERGVDEATAAERFGAIGAQRQLFQQLPGEAQREGQDRETQLGVVGGDIAATQRLERLQRLRTGRFSGSANFAGGREGFALGDAS